MGAWETQKKAKTDIDNIFSDLHNSFDVESEESHNRFMATKPPK